MSSDSTLFVSENICKGVTFQILISNCTVIISNNNAGVMEILNSNVKFHGTLGTEGFILGFMFS